MSSTSPVHFVVGVTLRKSLGGPATTTNVSPAVPLAADCYLALHWRLPIPPGRQECACQQECIWGNGARWRMVRSFCCCFPPLCENESINSTPATPIPPPPPPHPRSQSSLCLLSVFVSKMIPSVMSKATLSYSYCLGNQCWERQWLKASLVCLKLLEHERLFMVLPELEDWHIWKALYSEKISVSWETPSWICFN